MMAADLDGFEDGHAEARVAAVSLQHVGRLQSYLAGNLALRRGDRVLVDSEGGPRLAIVEVEPHRPPRGVDLARLKPILRNAGEDDLRQEEENREREGDARRLFLKRVGERKLAMKLVNVEFTHDGRKAIFYYAAEGRVDFRELVRELASAIQVRIELKQIGARDESKLSGGVGPCGRELCCSSWLREFDAVTVKMAREQGLALSPSRLVGMCGRLKCCLRYEFATYVELRRLLPAVGKPVQSLKGDGKVLQHNVLKQTVLIQRAEDGGVVEASLAELVARREE